VRRISPRYAARTPALPSRTGVLAARTVAGGARDDKHK
jgi:hypothetical protein